MPAHHGPRALRRVTPERASLRQPCVLSRITPSASPPSPTVLTAPTPRQAAPSRTHDTCRMRAWGRPGPTHSTPSRLILLPLVTSRYPLALSGVDLNCGFACDFECEHIPGFSDFAAVFGHAQVQAFARAEFEEEPLVTAFC